jgi:hypothetical protein
MGLLCPLCGKEHAGIDRVMSAVLTMLHQVNAWEHKQPPVPVLLRPRLTVVPAKHAA